METPQPQSSLRGVLASLLASALFGLVFYLSGAIDATTETVFAWRVLMTLACYALALSFPPARRALRQFWNSLVSTRWMPLLFLTLCLLIGLQLWLFAWTPMHGHALDASLGYLLLPIALVLVGRGVFKSPITMMQWLAVVIAVSAVAIKISTGAILSWVTMAICVGYALYFTLRKYFRLDGPIAYGVEVLVLSPLAIYLLTVTAESLEPTARILVIIAGLLGALAMALYLAASTLLSMPVFGLPSYGEPLLLFIVALILGESLGTSDLFVYGLLAVALTILAADGYVRGRKAESRRPQLNTDEPARELAAKPAD